MSTTWILVANARHARLFAHHGPNQGLELVTETVAEKSADAMMTPNGGRTPRRGDPPKHQAQGFAHRLARELYQGRSRGRYAHAILVAPPAFMGMLNSELDKPTASLVSKRVDKDYTKTGKGALSSHLEHCLCV
ncbi:MAG TPA: host attachment protein [Rhodocyclaceae bacterium]|nr:host attachment protein [Rhodocyclaceae bacterium]